MLAGVHLGNIVAFLLFFAGAGLMSAAEPDVKPSGAPKTGPNTNSLTELDKIEVADGAAQEETERWVRENTGLKAKGSGVSDSELEARIATRFEPVRKSYEDYVHDHPKDAHGHLVYGNFLNERDNEHGAQMEWESALALDPTNAVIYNNLAGRYAEGGPVEKVFGYFEKAIALAPGEPVYYHNFGDGLYVLRTHAAKYYGINEQQVYQKVLFMYSNAFRLDPQNFPFARDLAQTCYSLKPLPVEQALYAWTNALRIATNEVDREDAQVHLARVKMLAGRLTEAREQLAGVTNQTWLKARDSLLHNIAEREK
jgi:tetratricopeptide (TPR) repeat protein